ncbi:MAG TPA: hypothetical protein VL137_00630 [Polyangiaceae bacterium]|nr:hypothetical protein [Polyangiaceae bacterium]
MPIRRITISVPAQVAGRIKKAAGRKPVSTWVTDLIEEHLDDAELERQWAEFCRETKPTRKDSQKADALFSRLTRRSARRGAA